MHIKRMFDVTDKTERHKVSKKCSTIRLQRFLDEHPYVEDDLLF